MQIPRLLRSRRTRIVLALLAMALCGGVLLRAWAVGAGLARLEARLARHGVRMQVEGHHWMGWRRLCLEGLRLDGPQGLSLEADRMEVLLRPWAGMGWQAVEQLDAPHMRLRRGHQRWDLRACARPHSASVAMQVHQADAHRPGDALHGVQAQLHMTRRAGALLIQARWADFQAQHRLLAPGPVAVASGRMALRLRPHRDEFLLEAGSGLWLADWRAALGGSYRLSDQQLQLHAQCPMQPAADWLAALPEALRGSLCDARLGGRLGGSVALALRWGRPESLTLDAALQDSGLALLAGGPDFGRWRAAAQAGPRWSRRLPPVVLRAILLSEDAGFAAHRGFDPRFIGSALAHDWRAGRFERGGGTLSMQLMRNLFLRRDKVLARKAEEALLTLLAERAQLLSKDDILDLYLDRVEWGPDVYGIAQACRHYFDCTPEALSLDQGLFLAAVLPNPRMSKTLLDAEGELGAFAQQYYDGMRWLLYLEGLVAEEELDRPYPRFVGIVEGAGGRI